MAVKGDHKHSTSICECLSVCIHTSVSLRMKIKCTSDISDSLPALFACLHTDRTFWSTLHLQADILTDQHVHVHQGGKIKDKSPDIDIGNVGVGNLKHLSQRHN